MVADTAHDPPPALQRIFKSKLFLAGILVGATLLVYLPVFDAGFIWDDDTFLFKNPMIHAPDGLYRFWFTTEPPDYFPLTSSMLWLEWRLWGDDATGYHIVNVLLHAISALLLWRLLAALKIPGAWLAGLLFAVHPVNVESVAWITERKNTLPMVFYLLTLWAYLRFDQTSLRRWYAIALGTFVLGLLSKTSIVMLPVVLLGYACWRRGKLTRQDLLRSVPFFALSLVFGLITVWYQTQVAIGDEVVRTDGMTSRLAVAGCAVWFYLYKAILPINLCFVYPRWSIDPHAFASWLPLLALAGGFIGLLVYRNAWTRAMRFALAYFVITLLPVLGFVNIFFMKFSLVADHWQYFSIIGIITLSCAGLGLWLQRSRNAWRGVIVACVFAGLGALSYRQTQIYTNVETLYKDTLAKNPQCWMAHYNLGLSLVASGRLQDAIVHYLETVRIRPDHVEAHVNLGVAFRQLGRRQEAIVHYQQALQHSPDSTKAHVNMGVVLTELGRPQEAIAHYQQALQIKPDNADAHSNLGVALTALGRPQEAIVHFQQALRIKPDSYEAQYSWGAALQAMGQYEAAAEHFRETLRMKPDFADAYNSLGIAEAGMGRFAEAIEHFEHALRLNPDHKNARKNLEVLRAQ